MDPNLYHEEYRNAINSVFIYTVLHIYIYVSLIFLLSFHIHD